MALLQGAGDVAAVADDQQDAGLGPVLEDIIDVQDVLGGFFHPTRFAVGDGPAIEAAHGRQETPGGMRGNAALVRHGKNFGVSAEDDEQQGGAAVAATDDEDGLAGDFHAAKKFVLEICGPGFQIAREIKRLSAGIFCSSFTNVGHISQVEPPREDGDGFSLKAEVQEVCQGKMMKEECGGKKRRDLIAQNRGSGAGCLWLCKCLRFSWERPQMDMGFPRSCKIDRFRLPCSDT